VRDAAKAIAGISKEGERKGVGTTRSGVEVEWFFDKKGNISTVYPVRGQ
jgi:hypothetical protein